MKTLRQWLAQLSCDSAIDKSVAMFELSENECAEIVRKATRHKNVVKIVDFSIDGFGNYLGFLGEYFRLKIDSNLDESHCELNFFVKTLPMRDLKQRKMLVETGIFSKEVKIYEKLLLDLSEISNDKRFWCPRAYYFRDDLLVLDDLSLKGFKMLPSHINFDRAHVEETLKTLSIYHTASIVYEENQTKSIPDEFGDLLFETSVDDRDWFHAGLRVISCYFIAYTKVSTCFYVSPDDLRHCFAANTLWEISSWFIAKGFLSENLRSHQNYAKCAVWCFESSRSSRCLAK